MGAIEFLGTGILATGGVRTMRNLIALAITVGGVAALTDVRLVAHPLGFVLAFANCAGFMAYVVLGHRIANSSLGKSVRGAWTASASSVGHGRRRRGATPIGLGGAIPACHNHSCAWWISVMRARLRRSRLRSVAASWSTSASSWVDA
ncbi:MAG: hypothetical protein ACRDY2_08630 [Acidimicrobiales bacterium]